MPQVNKTCIRCGNYIAHSRRKINCLCGECIRAVNEEFKYSLRRLRTDRDRGAGERNASD
jgi:hypothetical protein